jgi:hypothetical protein
MTKDYETIIEHILEAKDNGISLSSLLEKHPEQKGEYFDAWKFVESVDDHMCHDVLPRKEDFRLLLDIIPEQKPLLSQWMRYTGFAVPALVVIVLVFGYTSKNPTVDNSTLITQVEDTALFLADNNEMSSLAQQETSGQNTETMAKSAMLSPLSSPNTFDSIDTSFNQLENSFAQDSIAETSSSITFANASIYNDLSTIYD